MKPPFAHRVKKPFKYVVAAETNVAKTIREARKALEAAKEPPTNVQMLRKQAA